MHQMAKHLEDFYAKIPIAWHGYTKLSEIITKKLKFALFLPICLNRNRVLNLHYNLISRGFHVGLIPGILEINNHCFKKLKNYFYFLKMLKIYFDCCKTYLRS